MRLLIATICAVGLIAAAPVTTADPVIAVCQFNSIPGSACVVDFVVDKNLGFVDFQMQGASLSFKGTLESNDKLDVSIIGIDSKTFAADSGTCAVAPGHVLCSGKIGETSITVEATR